MTFSGAHLCGCECVINAVLAVQHLCNEIERETRTEGNALPIIDRVSAANTAAELVLDRSGDGYAGFLDLVRIRDAIEHPRSLNTYNGRPGEWDQVPLAWMLSERSLTAIERWDVWFDLFVTAWKRYLERRGPIVQTFEGVTRGVRSKRQYKKPPSTRA